MDRPLDELIDRLVDGEATEDEWEAFRRQAATCHEPWRRLAEEQRRMARLAAEVEAVIAPALNIELPTGSPARRTRGVAWLGPTLRSPGWAAAALIMIAWTASVAMRPSVHAPASTQTVATPMVDDSSLMARYLQLPHVVAELPPTLVGLTQTPDGPQMTYVRQIVERRPVEEMYGLAWDEHNRPILRRESSPQIIRAEHRYD